MVTVIFRHIDGETAKAEAATHDEAAVSLWLTYLCTDEGPLSVRPSTFENLENAVVDAFGGEAEVTEE